MVKVFGFSRDLDSAFEIIDLMEVYKIKPSIILFTNLIHISFYCRDWRMADKAYRSFKSYKLKGDCLLYSKIIDGFLRFKKL